MKLMTSLLFIADIGLFFVSIFFMISALAVFLHALNYRYWKAKSPYINWTKEWEDARRYMTNFSPPIFQKLSIPMEIAEKEIT